MQDVFVWNSPLPLKFSRRFALAFIQPRIPLPPDNGQRTTDQSRNFALAFIRPRIPLFPDNGQRTTDH